MTPGTGLDFTGPVHFYQNGGVAQSQICGQGLVTKLLKQHKKPGQSKTPLVVAEDSTAFHKEAAAAASLCMSPLTVPKKIKYRKSNVYENMNQTSIETESCTSDDIFSETASNASSPLLVPMDEMKTPAFVAQFDPLQLLTPSTTTSTSTAASVELQKRTKQQTASNAAAASGARKTATPSWSASLPSVVEEDSQSEQGSQQQLPQQAADPASWRTGVAGQTQGSDRKSIDDARAFLDGVEKLFNQAVLSESMASVESGGVSTITSSESTKQQNPSRNVNEAKDSKTLATKKKKREQKPPKLSKQERMKVAMERKIQQAIDVELQQKGTSKDDKEGEKDFHLEIFDAASAFALSTSKESPTSKHIFDPFHMHSSPTSNSLFASDQHFPFGAHRSSQMGVSRTAQDLLLQQQATLKEISFQNYHYRKELTECKAMFETWKQERKEQHATIGTLTKEKESYEKEATLLRDEVSSIRLELEELRKETKLHAEYQQFQNQQQQLHQPQQKDTAESKEDNKPQTLSAQVEAITKEQDETTMKEQDEKTTTKALDKPLVSNLQSNATTTKDPNKEPRASKLKEIPPKESTMTQVSKLKEKDTSSNDSSHQYLISGFTSSPTKKTVHSKSLVSGLKSSSRTHSVASKRSVKFHDPPKNKEWTVFPTGVHDGKVGYSLEDSSGFKIDKINYTKVSVLTEERRQDQDPKSEGTKTVRIREPPEEEVGIVPISQRQSIIGDEQSMALGRMFDELGQSEVTSVYKYRLETIQKNRQQRSASSKGQGVASTCTPIKRKNHTGAI